jgi:hypothetical protein
MIVLVSDGGVNLDDLDNLRAFKIVAPAASKAALGVALGPAGRFDGEAGWVSEAWLRRETSAQPAAWAADFEKMITFAKAKGWYDEASQAVRAHVDWTD